MADPATPRSAAKRTRRLALLDAAAKLFAAQGFSAVSLEELGSAAGVSGPAVYRHFPGKQAVLGALLREVSGELLEGGRAVVGEAADDGERALRGLVAFHVDFALAKPDVIRVQDREFASLSPEDQAAVRGLQLDYIEVWMQALAPFHQATPGELRLRAQAVFGLINSTPHSVRSSSVRVPAKVARRLLEEMALAALLSGAS